MKTGTIVRVSRIERDSKGNVINGIVIQLSNGSTLYRKLSQFKVDLSNSGRLLGYNLDNINSVNHIAIAEECAKLAKGTVSGDYKMVKAGDEYIDENPASPDFGKPKTYEKDFIRVDGFLDITPNIQERQLEANAKATATLNAQLSGMFDSFSSVADSNDSADDISPEMLSELEGAIASQAVAEEIVEKVTTDTKK